MNNNIGIAIVAGAAAGYLSSGVFVAAGLCRAFGVDQPILECVPSVTFKLLTLGLFGF